MSDVPNDGWVKIFLPLIIVVGVIFVLFMVMMSMQTRTMMQDGGGSGSSKMLDFGKSRADMLMPENIPFRFNDVAGLHEEKEQMREVVDFLKNPDKYKKLGARIPKGILLVGPP